MSRFTKAERKKAKLRLAMTGVSGSGKTYSALLIAKGMGGRTAVIDTEHESSSLYANEFEFDSTNLKDHSPESYIAAINDAVKEGYDNIIIDSLSHVWNYCKEEVDVIAAKLFKGNSWAAWSKVTPRYNALIQTIIQCKAHVIVTMRAKTETAQIEVGNGKKKVVKLGMKTEMRDGIEFEFTTVIDLEHETKVATVSKDRTHIFESREDVPITEDIGRALMDWLMKGVDPYVSQEQLKNLHEQMAQITHPAAKARINNEIPDFSFIAFNEYENVMSRLGKVIEWQQEQQSSQPPVQPTPPNQMADQAMIH